MICDGPTFCDKCGEWPARASIYGTLCHNCETREYCIHHPVPLPKDPKMLRELSNSDVERWCVNTLERTGGRLD